MATRQYIGARYVPKFFDNPDGSNNWLEGVSYEALTIVTFAGNSYTSKIPVPANVGSPNLNQSYWVSTGSGGGGDINELQKQVNKNTTDISNIKSTISNLNKKYIFITDSYGTIKSSENKSFIDYACENIGITDDQRYNIYSSGAGFVPAGSGKAFSVLLNELNVAEPDSITDIFVFSGANDAVNSGLINGFKNFKSIQEQKFPNAKIYVGMLSQYFNKVAVNSTLAKLMLYKQNCILTGMNYLENTECIMHQFSWFDTDLLHPKSSVIKNIGEFVSPFISDYKGNVIKYIPITANTIAGGFSSITVNAQMVQFNQNAFITPSIVSAVPLIFSGTLGEGNVFLFNKAFTINDTFIVNQNLPITFSTLGNNTNVPATGYMYVNQPEVNDTYISIKSFITTSNTQVDGAYGYQMGEVNIFNMYRTN